MSAIAYTPSSFRALKARFAARLGKRSLKVEAGLILILAMGGSYAIISGYRQGVGLLGLGLAALIFSLWHRWDLMRLAPPANAWQVQPLHLDLVVEQTLLARLKPGMSADQVWLAACLQWEAAFVLQRLAMPATVISDILAKTTVQSDAIWQTASELAHTESGEEIDSAAVVVAVLTTVPEIQPVLAHLKRTNEQVLSVFAWQQRAKRSIKGLSQAPYFGGIGRDWASGYTPLLSRFGTNLSRDIEQGYYRTIPSLHEPLIHQLTELLDKRHPVALIGGVGSGKTALIYSLAERILKPEAVGGLNYFQVVSLNASELIASGAALEDIMLRLLGEAAAARNSIIFLDEAQLFLNAGSGSVDITQILLPVLKNSSVPLILAMSDHDWQGLTARNPGFTGQLQRLTLIEPSEPEVVAVVQDAAIGIEHQAGAIIQHPAVLEAVRLAGRYLPELAFPGKAITVLESASSYVQQGFITADSVQRAVEATTGAKLTSASAPERQQLLNLEDQIHSRMVNQVRAVKVVADALRRSRAGVGSAKRPVGSFLFLGPTGVGKTELAKALAVSYFGGVEAMVRLDMSEYQQPSDVSRLLAPSSDSQAGQTLASGVRQRPSTVVLLDEIEKSHPDILNLLLQLLDEGRLTDSDGRSVSFRDAIVICTSNAGADEIRQRIAEGQQLENFESMITDQLIKEHTFKPELLNRFDEIVVFRPLTKAELHQVVELMLGEVNASLKSQNITIKV
ncbi:MAG TPA: AAA family ATPase, partial [Candidatus Saccharimonadia bacterium]